MTDSIRGWEAINKGAPVSKPVALALLLGVATLGYAQPAACVYCTTTPCYGPCFQYDCVCLQPPGSIGKGHCYGMPQATTLKAQGYTEVTQ